jgi:hypothetical protein
MTDKKAFKIDVPTVIRFLLGGGAVGIGAGAGTSLLNHLRSLERKSSKESDTSFDDDTLFVNVPGQTKKAFVSLDSSGEHADSSATTTAKILAALLGTGLAYNTTRNIYINKRKKQLQQEVDQLQNIHLRGLIDQREWDKQASIFKDTAGAAAAASLLTALGSAAVTNKILSHYMPGYEKSPNMGPRRVVVRRVPVTNSSRDGMDKTIPVEEVEDVTQQELENLIRLKQASAGKGELNDLLCAVAQGRLDEVVKVAKDSGIESALDLVEGTSKAAAINPYAKDMAVTAVAGHPFLGEAIAPLVAADFYDMAGSFCKVASAPEFSEIELDCRRVAEAMGELGRLARWEKVANVVVREVAARSGMSKEAALRPLAALAERKAPNSVMTGLLMADLLARKVDRGQTSEQEGSVLRGAEIDISEDPEADVDPDAEKFVKDNPDIVDSILDEVTNGAA